jgi:hypothetical protein
MLKQARVEYACKGFTVSVDFKDPAMLLVALLYLKEEDVCRAFSEALRAASTAATPPQPTPSQSNAGGQ